MPFHLGLSQYGDVHLGHFLGLYGVLGIHVWLQRKHFKVGSLNVCVMARLYLYVGILSTYDSFGFESDNGL